MSASPADGPVAGQPGVDPGTDRPLVPPAAPWGGWREVRADLRTSVRLLLVLALAGVVVGLLWWGLAPRADFKVTGSGPVVIGNPSEELMVADDGVLVLLLVGFGLVAGAAAWFLRRRRGVATVLALAVGASLMAVVAWQLGELLGAGPTKADLARVGNVVTTPLSLASLPALALAPFSALLAYLVPVIAMHRDDLGRTPAPELSLPTVTEDDIGDPRDEQLVDVPRGPGGVS